MGDRDESNRPRASAEAGHEEQPRGKSMGERIRDLVDAVIGALDEVLAPAPEPVPIPVRTRPYPYRRR